MRVAVIMAGGAGQRFWPYSREVHPKQILPLTDDSTLLEESVERVSDVIPQERIFIVANDVLKKSILRKMPAFPEQNVIVEPMGKNTSACLALAAAFLLRHHHDPTMVVLTADHLVRKIEMFHKNLNLACEIAESKKMLVTFGIPPTRPETGFGYIEIGDVLKETSDGNVYRVKRFREKPNEETALQFLEAGDFLWNSGMFVWKTSDLVKGFKQFFPDLFKGHKEILHALGSSDEKVRLATAFEQMPAISIDYSVMEKASNVAVVRGDFEWDDIGSWRSLLRIRSRDQYGNVIDGEALPVKTSNCVLFNTVREKTPLLVTLGLRDQVVVVTDDVILVCDAHRDQQVKEIVQELKSRGMGEYL